MSIDQSFDKNDILRKLNNISSLDIKTNLEQAETVDGKHFFYASIMASELELLNKIEEIDFIEFDGTMSIQS
jgi:hypothetical protein